MAGQRRRESLYPKRIAGISFSEDDYNRIQAVCGTQSLAEAQVIRGAVATGLVVYEGGLQNRIAQEAAKLGIPESRVVRGAIEEGLEEFLRLYRSQKRLAMLQELRDELGTGDEDLKLALRDYLHKHRKLNELVGEEEFFQKTIEKEDEQQEEEDRERQQEVDSFLVGQGRSASKSS